MKLIHSISAAILFTLAVPAQAGTPVQQAIFAGSPNGGGTPGMPPLAAGHGLSVAVSGETVVVGAPHETVGGLNIGRAYVYVRSGGTWTQQAVLQASNADTNDWFGYAVAISGDTIVVGAPQEDGGIDAPLSDNSAGDAGAAYVFTRSGTTWTEQAYLKASVFSPGRRFGGSVAISGSTIAVGSVFSPYQLFNGAFYVQGDSSDATGVDGDERSTAAPGSGAVYVFFRHGNRWLKEAYLKASNTDVGDQFGFSLALSGDTLIAGAPYESSNASGVNGNQADNSLGYAGAAYVFVRTNGVWAQQAYLKAGTPLSYQCFGWSMAISGDTVAVGAAAPDYGFPEDYRRVHVFTRGAGGVWSQQQVLASDTPAENGFGYAVALWNDTLVVSEPSDAFFAAHNGKLHVFNRSAAGTWTRQVVVTASGPPSLGDFGHSLAIEGDVLAVGTGYNDVYVKAGQNKTWIYGHVGQPDIAVEQPSGTALASGGTRMIAAVPGAATDVVFTLGNTGGDTLTLTGTPALVAVSGSSDFSIAAQPAATVAAGGSTTFTVRFTPATAGLKTATLSIPSDDPDESPYVINLTGRGLSFTVDTDGDGMSDAAEFQLAALGFDWQTSQPAQVATYFANANNNGLYTTAQVQALNVGVPLLQRNAATGKFTLTIGVKKTAALGQPFADFPMTGPGTSTVINGSGKVEFEFPAPGNAAFFRLESQ